MLPPPTEPGIVLQRGDEVNTMHRMLGDGQTSAVILTGEVGAGKSTLAGLLFRRFQQAALAGTPVTRHLVWLGLGETTTLPDLLAAILEGLNMGVAGFGHLKPEEQITTIFNMLRNPQENAFVVLDQFDLLFDPETGQPLAGRGAVQLFLEMLQADIGASRLLLTCHSSPYGPQNGEETRVRSYLVSRITLPEGVALLQQRGVQGLPEELSLVWQRCAGHTFALVLFSALVHLTGFSLSYLLNSPDYQSLWSSDVTLLLAATVYHYLNPIQRSLMRVLALFSEAVPFEGLKMAIGGNNQAIDASAFEYELGILTQLALVQQVVDEQGITCFALSPLLRYYVLATYLEGDGQQTQQNGYALGVSGPLGDTMSGPEVQAVALAAGHIRVAAYYQRLKQQSPPAGQRRGPLDVEPLLAELRYLCFGWQWQQACDLLFAEGLHEQMLQWGAWNTLIQLYVAMLPPVGVLTSQDESLVAGHLGLLYGRLGEYELSHYYFAQALATQREIGDQANEISTLVNQGEIFRLQGEWNQAQSNFEQALHLNQQWQDPLLASVLSHNLGLLQQGKKEYAQALRYYLDSFQLMNTVKDPQLQDPYKGGIILTNIGLLLYEQGRQAEAISILLIALQIRHSVSDPTVGSVERFLGTLEQKMGSEAFAQLYQTAQGMQQEVLSRLLAANMRQ